MTEPPTALRALLLYDRLGRRSGDLAALRDALSAGADPNIHNPLAYAAEHGLTDAVRILLAAGADPNANDFQAYRAAAKHGHADVLRLLIPLRYPETEYTRAVQSLYNPAAPPPTDPYLAEEHDWIRRGAPPNPDAVIWPEDAVPAISTFRSRVPTSPHLQTRVLTRLPPLIARTLGLRGITFHDAYVQIAPGQGVLASTVPDFLEAGRAAPHRTIAGNLVLIYPSVQQGHATFATYRNRTLHLFDPGRPSTTLATYLRTLLRPDERLTEVASACPIDLQTTFEPDAERGYCSIFGLYYFHTVLLNPERSGPELVAALLRRPRGYLVPTLRRYRCWLLSLYAEWVRAERPDLVPVLDAYTPDLFLGRCEQRAESGPD